MGRFAAVSPLNKCEKGVTYLETDRNAGETWNLDVRTIPER